MAQIQIPNLPAAIALNGTEELEIVQAGTSVRATTQQVANLSVGAAYGAHGSFYSTAIQTNPVASAVNKMTLNSTDMSVGVAVVSNSRMRVDYAGAYNLQFSAQLEKSGGGSTDIDIWIQINGTNVPYSNTRVFLQGNGAKQVAAWNWFVSLTANQYVEICWSSPDANVILHAEPATTLPTRPGVPSVIATMQMVKPV